jgi:hypothetical protein
MMTALALMVAAARLRARRMLPHDAHELLHLWAAVNAGNSDHGPVCAALAAPVKEEPR